MKKFIKSIIIIFISIIVMLVGTIIIFPCFYRDIFFYASEKLPHYIISHTLGPGIHLPKDSQDPGAVLRIMAIHLKLVQKCDKLPTTQNDYNLFEYYALSSSPLRDNKTAKRKRKYTFFPSNNFFKLSVKPCEYLPELFIDSTNSTPKFAYNSLPEEHIALKLLMSNLTKSSVCSLTRYWDVREGINLLEYLTPSKFCIKYLKERIKDPKEHFSIRDTCQTTLKTITNKYSANVKYNCNSL